jgi:peptide/nickel transport system permease protein
MNDADHNPQQGQAAWSRFARAFVARATSRWARRALLAIIGLAVLAPFLANQRPYFVHVRDPQSFHAARVLLQPIARGLAEEALALAAAPAGERARLEGELRVLRHALGQLERGLGEDTANSDARASLAAIEKAADELCRAALAGDLLVCTGRGRELQSWVLGAEANLAARSAENPAGILLEPASSWPLLGALSGADIFVLCLWLGAVFWRLWSRYLPGKSVLARAFLLAALALVSGVCAELLPRAEQTLDPGTWKALVAQDPDHTVVFAPIAYGPNETELAFANRAPSWSAAGGTWGAHWCGTDPLGRDQLARLLHAGRTSLAVAFLAALLIVIFGAALGLAAGALRGAVDIVVSRAIELLQALPTLVLLLGLVSLLPSAAANSRWTIPLVIAAVGWTHIARLARAEALVVRESAFVRAAQAAGFSPARVLWRHVLPNSLGPVWIAASFVLSAGLVLESSAAFLGFGVQHPAPSWGGLLALARGGDHWWLALFPGLWLFAAILSIHLVGEGVRTALDPRDEAGAR